MTHLRPCARCRFRYDCSRQTEMLTALSTAPVRVSLANFACDWRLEGLEPGAVAFATLPKLVYQEAAAPDDASGWVPADPPEIVSVKVAVMEPAKNKLRVYVLDRSGTVNPLIHVWPDQLRPTGETVPLCVECARPLDSPTEGMTFWPCGERGKHVAGEA